MPASEIRNAVFAVLVHRNEWVTLELRISYGRADAELAPVSRAAFALVWFHRIARTPFKWIATRFPIFKLFAIPFPVFPNGRYFKYLLELFLV